MRRALVLLSCLAAARASCLVSVHTHWPRDACVQYDISPLGWCSQNAGGRSDELLLKGATSRVSPLDGLRPEAGFRVPAANLQDFDSTNCPAGVREVYEVSCGPTSLDVITDSSCTRMHALTSPAGCGVALSGNSCDSLPVPTPSAPQLAYQEDELVALTHFNMATFFGDGDPACNPSNWPQSHAPSAFAPSQLDTDNWVQSYVAFGAKEAVLTAKHGCGFALWPTKVQLPNGTIYPYAINGPGGIGVDVLSNFISSVSNVGIGHGFYYSFHDSYFLNVPQGGIVSPNPPLPGMADVTQAEVESIFVQHVTELWSNFGNLTEIWFDGGYQASVQANLTHLLNTLQPQAVVFGGAGISNNPLRWVGTESGMPSYPIWSTGCGNGQGDPDSTEWCPATSDTTLQDGDHWFYTPGDGIRSLSELIEVYHATVGANSVLEMDFAIDRTGRVDPVHANRYQEFGDWIRNCYGSAIVSSPGSNQSVIVLTLPTSNQITDRVWIREDQSQGQRVRTYTVEYTAPGAPTEWLPFANGTCVGNKRIELLSVPIKAGQVRLNVTSGIAYPVIKEFAVFAPCLSA